MGPPQNPPYANISERGPSAPSKSLTRTRPQNPPPDDHSSKIAFIPSLGCRTPVPITKRHRIKGTLPHRETTKNKKRRKVLEGKKKKIENFHKNFPRKKKKKKKKKK